MPHQMVETFAIIPFLFLLFFSTAFSPGSGLPGIKALRYLFSRFYFWCMVDGVKDQMEGCPADPQINMLLLCLSGLSTVLVFVAYFGIRNFFRKDQQKAHVEKLTTALQDDPFYQSLQRELYDEGTASAKKQRNAKAKISAAPAMIKQLSTEDLSSSSDSDLYMLETEALLKAVEDEVQC